MGYTTKGEIQSYTPEDTETTLYVLSIPGLYSLQDILDLAQSKWPGVSLEDIQIEPEHIHTNCLTYVLYDASDYTEYLVLTLRQ